MSEETTKLAKQHLSPKDVFLHFAVIVSLYFLVAGVLTLAFQIINLTVADTATDAYRTAESYAGPLRYAISSLVVVTPLFFVFNWLLNKAYRVNTDARQSRLRKWLLYFTIFAAVAIMAGDLVTLVYSFLQGEVTMRFALKALSFLVVFGAVFWYYLHDVRLEKPEGDYKKFAIPVVVIILAGLIAGVLLIPSPAEQRKIRLDDRRVSDLQQIQSSVGNYWVTNGKLPITLAAITDSTMPKDPTTGAAYEYKILEEVAGKSGKFQLCATFDTDSAKSAGNIGNIRTLSYPAMPVGSVYSHGAGHVCFEQTASEATYGKPLVQ